MRPNRESRRRLLLAGLAAPMLASVCGTVRAQKAWPSQPLKLIVPFPPGNNADVLARAISSEMSARLGQAVIVDNKPGAGGVIGVDAAVRAAPDGHTVLFASLSAITIMPALGKKLPYDPVQQLEPVLRISEGPMILAVPATSPAASAADFIALARSKPGAMNYGSLGPGTIAQLTAAMFQQMTGIKLTEVPYKGSGQAVTAVITGEVDAIFDGMGSLLPQIKAGKVKALAVTTSTRAEQLPAVPTMAELGIPALRSFESSGWTAAYLPKGCPPEIVAKLHETLVEILKKEEIRGRIAFAGLTVPAPHSSRELAEFIRLDYLKWQRVAKAANITLTE